MFMNQLSPGDKMSLKGKIFELQKKLNLLDVEQQNTEDFSFHPEITRYKLPNRQDDFINNLNQAEETRKDKFESLKKQLIIERSQDCSFAPQINNRKKDQKQKRSQKPVHLRLTEKGKEYQDSAEKRLEKVKSHDFDGNELFKPTSAQKPRVAKGNMQVDEYLFRDAKDRVEKMDIKRENEKKILERIASKQKMNKHSALLVQRKCEREAREIFDSMYSVIPLKTPCDDEETSDNNPIIESSHLQKMTISMLKFYEQHKGSLSFHNSISNATSPYAVAEKMWQILDVDETNEVSLQTFLSISVPVLVSGGSNSDVSTSLATTKDRTVDNTHPPMSSATASSLHQFLSAIYYYINKKKKMEKENESSNPKDKKITRKQALSKANNMAAKSMMSSINMSQDTSVANSEDDQTLGDAATEGTDDEVSISDSLKSYNKKAALSRRIQTYNQVLTQREIQANNRMEMLRESLIQKEMEECTFQPTISTTAKRLKDKENSMYQSQQLDDSGSVSVTGGPLKVYDRLYAKKDAVPRSIAQEKHEPSANHRDGLDECTFVPQVRHSSYVAFNHDIQASSQEGDEEEEDEKQRHKKENNMDSFFGDLEMEAESQDIFKPTPPPPPPAVPKKKKAKPKSTEPDKQPVLAPRGYADSIKRIRDAALNKKKKEAEDEAFFAVNEERYNKGLQQMAEGPKPFRFRTDERHTEKEKMYAEVMQAQGIDMSAHKFSGGDGGESIDLRSSKGGTSLPSDALDSIRGKTKKIHGVLQPIRLYVEIKLGAAKKSHIAVADFDVPVLLARDFCKIYGLDTGAEGVLAQVVENNMISNAIPIGSIDANEMHAATDRITNHRSRSFADSKTTFSSNNFDLMDDEDYNFYDNSNVSPQESSTPLYDHAF